MPVKLISVNERGSWCRTHILYIVKSGHFTGIMFMLHHATFAIVCEKHLFELVLFRFWLPSLFTLECGGNVVTERAHHWIQTLGILSCYNKQRMDIASYKLSYKSPRYENNTWNPVRRNNTFTVNCHIRHSRAGRALQCWRRECGRLWVQLASAAYSPVYAYVSGQWPI